MTSRTSDSSEWANLSAAVLQATGTDRSCGGSSNRRGQTLAVLQAAGADGPCPRLCSRHNRCGQTLSAAVQSNRCDRPCLRLCCKRQARTDSVRGCGLGDWRGQTLSAAVLQATCADRLSKQKRADRLCPAALLQAVLQASGADRPCPRLCSATGADRRGSAPRDMRGQTLSAAVLHERQVRTDPVRGCSLSDRRGQTLSTAVLQPRGLSAAVP